jgi:hypothetical protein
VHGISTSPSSSLSLLSLLSLIEEGLFLRRGERLPVALPQLVACHICETPHEVDASVLAIRDNREVVRFLLSNYLANSLILGLDQSVVTGQLLLMLYEHILEEGRTKQATNLVNM